MRELSGRGALPRIESVYQPIVDLDTGATVAFEALARPIGTPRIDFAGLLTRAMQEDRVAELDWACRAAALRGALHSTASVGTVFINAEPTTGDRGPENRTQRGLMQRAETELQVVIEVTERSLLDHPANVLRLAAWARSRGWGIAIDDVGAYPESLAVLPFVAPDVIKLDMTLVQTTPGRDQARCISAVMAHVERSGAVMLAEGIETAAHLEQARAFGARLGQGYLLGRPAAVPARAAS